MSQNKEELLLESDLSQSFEFQKKLNGFSDDQNERVQYLALTTHHTYDEIVRFVRSFRRSLLSVDSEMNISLVNDEAIDSAERTYK